MEIRKFARFVTCAILLANILTGSVQAQSDPYKKEPVKLHLYQLVDDKSQPADKLRNHPEIIYAEIKVREAEADLNRVRQQVLAKIGVLDAEIKAAQSIFKEAIRRLAELEQIRNSPGGDKKVQDWELGDYRVAVSKYQGDLLVKRSQLPLLLGIETTAKGIDEKTQPSLENALAMALKKNSDIIQAQHKILEAEANLVRTRQQLQERILKTQAELEATLKILAEAKRRLGVLEQIYNQPLGDKHVSQQELSDARVAVAKYEGDLAVRKAALPYLVGDDEKKPQMKVARLDFTREEESPSVLKTYFIANNNADQVAKALQVSYKDRTDVRITTIGASQIMVYAPAPVQAAIAQNVELPSPEQAVFANAAEIEQALNTMVEVDIRSISLAEVLSALQGRLEKAKIKVNLVAGMDISISPVSLKEPVSLRHALQYLEDANDIRFVVRHYGIIGIRSDRMPPDGIALRYFVLEKKEPISPKK